MPNGGKGRAEEIQFFNDFARFTDVVNKVYLPDGSWDGGPWRLEVLEDNCISEYESFSYSRRYTTYYNQFPVGRIEVRNRPGTSIEHYDRQNPIN
jgi:hypothetical protein